MDDKRYTFILVMLIVVFGITFFIALGDLNTGQALFDIGIPPEMENWLVMLLSIASIIRIIVELSKK